MGIGGRGWEPCLLRLTPCPQCPPHPPHPACPHPVLVASSSSSCPAAALVLFILRAKHWVRSGPMQVCMFWLTPFTPRQPLTTGRGAGTAWVGGQSPSAAPLGLGTCRQKCPVKCSITPVHEAPRGLGQPGALPRPGGTCESSPGLTGLQGSPGSPPAAHGAAGATWRSGAPRRQPRGRECRPRR